MLCCTEAQNNPATHFRGLRRVPRTIPNNPLFCCDCRAIVSGTEHRTKNTQLHKYMWEVRSIWARCCRDRGVAGETTKTQPPNKTPIMFARPISTSTLAPPHQLPLASLVLYIIWCFVSNNQPQPLFRAACRYKVFTGPSLRPPSTWHINRTQQTLTAGGLR